MDEKQTEKETFNEAYTAGIKEVSQTTKEEMLDYICNPKEMKCIVYTIEQTIGCVFEDGSDTRKTTTTHETYQFSTPWELEEIRENVEVGYYENQDYSNQVHLSHKIISAAELRSILNETQYWSS